MSNGWRGDGPTYRVTWGDREWTLRVDGPSPALADDTGALGPRLGLAGVAEVGRTAPAALDGKTLVEHACRRGRIEATYAPPGWGELVVRACWAPTPEGGMDLEIQLSARSVGRLHAVEVLVHSGPIAPGPRASRFVEPRDARAAGLSYDGRETDLHRLTTLPPRDLGPLLSRAEGTRDIYAEFAHPRDVSRRTLWGGGSARAARYALFGHDLERGVVLRGRVRGHWLAEAQAAEFRALHARFLAEPPSLGV